MEQEGFFLSQNKQTHVYTQVILLVKCWTTFCHQNRLKYSGVPQQEVRVRRETFASRCCCRSSSCTCVMWIASTEIWWARRPQDSWLAVVLQETSLRWSELCDRQEVATRRWSAWVVKGWTMPGQSCFADAEESTLPRHGEQRLSLRMTRRPRQHMPQSTSGNSWIAGLWLRFDWPELADGRGTRATVQLE